MPPVTRYVNRSAPISSRNYPRPAYGNTYVTTNTTIINNNYQYDSSHYQVHVSNFYGDQSPVWGNRWRYGCAPSPVFGLSIGGSAFGFGFYVYTPFYTPCVPSPWYYNPYAPAYFPSSRVVVWSGYNCAWDAGVAYTYVPENAWNSYGNYPLNHAMWSLSQAYQYRNVGAIDGILGQGEIAVFREGRYEYSVNSLDFRQIMADNCNAIQTVSFAVTSVRSRPDGGVIECIHTYRTPLGTTEREYQTYNMHFVGGRYAITDFMTRHAYPTRIVPGPSPAAPLRFGEVGRFRFWGNRFIDPRANRGAPVSRLAVECFGGCGARRRASR